MKRIAILTCVLFALALSSCSYIPGTEQCKIRKNITDYVEKNLIFNGEEMHWGRIEYSENTSYDNMKCIFTEATYYLESNNNKTEKKIYLLMSNDCNTVLLSSEVPEVDWNPNYIKIESASKDDFTKCIQKLINTERL